MWIIWNGLILQEYMYIAHGLEFAKNNYDTRFKYKGLTKLNIQIFSARRGLVVEELAKVMAFLFSN